MENDEAKKELVRKELKECMGPALMEMTSAMLQVETLKELDAAEFVLQCLDELFDNVTKTAKEALEFKRGKLTDGS